MMMKMIFKLGSESQTCISIKTKRLPLAMLWFTENCDLTLSSSLFSWTLKLLWTESHPRAHASSQWMHESSPF